MNHLGSFFSLNACQHHETNLPSTEMICIAFYLPLLPMGRCQKYLHCRFHVESMSRVIFEHSFFLQFQSSHLVQFTQLVAQVMILGGELNLMPQN
jgi:hypothetical protein